MIVKRMQSLAKMVMVGSQACGETIGEERKINYQLPKFHTEQYNIVPYSIIIPHILYCRPYSLIIELFISTREKLSWAVKAIKQYLEQALNRSSTLKKLEKIFLFKLNFFLPKKEFVFLVAFSLGWV